MFFICALEMVFTARMAFVEMLVALETEPYGVVSILISNLVMCVNVNRSEEAYYIKTLY